jgi:hypothetical protein
LVTVCQVGQLAKAEQLKIAARIEAGEAAKDVVQDYLARKDVVHSSTEEILRHISEQMLRTYLRLDGRIHQLRPRHVRRERQGFLWAHELIEQLLALAEEHAEKYPGVTANKLIEQLLGRGKEHVEERDDETADNNAPPDGDGEEE